MRLGNLLPFALYVTFSRALVGRDSHDYYGGSDSLPLARVSRSRVPYQKNVSRLT
jgi:hypothetical protein